MVDETFLITLQAHLAHCIATSHAFHIIMLHGSTLLNHFAMSPAVSATHDRRDNLHTFHAVHVHFATIHAPPLISQAISENTHTGSLYDAS
jgi:hypothetical protein